MKILTRLLLSLLFVAAGVFHLRKPEIFLQVMPPQIPEPMTCILISGVCEILGGLGLLVPLPFVQRAAGWGLVLLLIAVFPANIYMAVAQIKVNGFPPHDWMAWARLPLQPLLMAAVIWVTGMWQGTCNKR